MSLQQINLTSAYSNYSVNNFTSKYLLQTKSLGGGSECLISPTNSNSGSSQQFRAPNETNLLEDENNLNLREPVNLADLHSEIDKAADLIAIAEEDSDSKSSDSMQESSQDYLQDSLEESTSSNGVNFNSQLNEVFDYLYYTILQENEKTKKIKDDIDSDKSEFQGILSKELEIYTKDLINYDESELMLNKSLLCSSSEIIEFELRNSKKLCTTWNTLGKFPESKLCKVLKFLCTKVTVSTNQSKLNTFINGQMHGNSSSNQGNLLRSSNSLNFSSAIKNQNEKQFKNIGSKECSKVSNYFSTLSKLLSEKNPNKDTWKNNQRENDSSVIVPQKYPGKFFIDRDAKSFGLMIQFLRNIQAPYFTDKAEESSFYEELEFWNIPYDKRGNYHLINFNIRNERTRVSV